MLFTLRALIAAPALLVCAPLSAQNFAISLANSRGLNHHVEVPSSPFTSPGREMTVEAWVRYLPAPNGTPTILHHSDGQGGMSYRLRVDAEAPAPQLEFSLQTTGGLTELQSVLTPAQLLGDWMHVAAVFDGGSATLFLDGSPAATAGGLTGTIASGGNLRVGDGAFVFGAGGARVWNGDIDELRIWGIARTPQEIAETMHEALVLVPNGVSFGFDGDYFDGSQFLVGTQVGTVNFVASSAPIGLPRPLVGLDGLVGDASTNCGSDLLRSHATSTSRAGNPDFAIRCSEGPIRAMGAVLFASAPSATPLPVVGIQLYLEPSALLPVTIAVASDAVGGARLPIALRPSTQVGQLLSAQFVFFDANCGPAGLVASQALTFRVQ